MIPADAIVTKSQVTGETYIINENGQRVIAPTRRADGTMRKEIKVRPGFIPQVKGHAGVSSLSCFCLSAEPFSSVSSYILHFLQEEQERYKSRGTRVVEGIREAKTSIPGLAPEEPQAPPGEGKKKRRSKAKGKIDAAAENAYSFEEPSFGGN